MDRRNVVLVTVDSLRADHCGFMGYDCDTTPNLDALADDGVVFENAIAPGPATSESMPAIFSGHYPVQRPSTDGSIDERIDRIRPHMEAHRTLADRFSEAGYSTAGFTPNPFTTRYFGFDEGFDHYRDFLDGSRGRLYRSLVNGSLGESRFSMPLRVLVNWYEQEEVFKPWEDFYGEILDWIEQTSEPYFLWVFLMDVHHPYLADETHRSDPLWRNFYANWKLRAQDYEPPFSESVHDALVTAYDDSITYADEFIGRLREDLETDDPITVVTADHGEAFGEHGSYEHHGGAFGQHGRQEYNSYLYEENLHVPLVVHDGESDETISEPISLRSLADLVSPARGETTISTDATAPFVTAQTMDGERIVVRGSRWKLHAGRDKTWVCDLSVGEEPADADAVTEELSRLVERRHETSRACESIAETAARLGDTT